MLKKIELLIINELKAGTKPETIAEDVCYFFIKNHIIKEHSEEYYLMKESFSEIAHLLKVKHITTQKY